MLTTLVGKTSTLSDAEIIGTVATFASNSVELFKKECESRHLTRSAVVYHSNRIADFKYDFDVGIVSYIAQGQDIFREEWSERIYRQFFDNTITVQPDYEHVRDLITTIMPDTYTVEGGLYELSAPVATSNSSTRGRVKLPHPCGGTGGTLVG